MPNSWSEEGIRNQSHAQSSEADSIGKQEEWDPMVMDFIKPDRTLTTSSDPESNSLPSVLRPSKDVDPVYESTPLVLEDDNSFGAACFFDNFPSSRWSVGAESEYSPSVSSSGPTFSVPISGSSSRRWSSSSHEQCSGTELDSSWSNLVGDSVSKYGTKIIDPLQLSESNQPTSALRNTASYELYSSSLTSSGQESKSQGEVGRAFALQSPSMPFICRYKNCDRAFTHQILQQNHERESHQNDMRFKCTESRCGLSYKYRFDLKRHYALKHNDTLETHNCPYCNESFARKSNLRRHLKVGHSITKGLATDYNTSLNAITDNQAYQDHELKWRTSIDTANIDSEVFPAGSTRIEDVSTDQCIDQVTLDTTTKTKISQHIGHDADLLSNALTQPVNKDHRKQKIVPLSGDRVLEQGRMQRGELLESGQSHHVFEDKKVLDTIFAKQMHLNGMSEKEVYEREEAARQVTGPLVGYAYVAYSNVTKQSSAEQGKGLTSFEFSLHEGSPTIESSDTFRPNVHPEPLQKSIDSAEATTARNPQFIEPRDASMQEGQMDDLTHYSSPSYSEASTMTIAEEPNAETQLFVDELARNIVCRCLAMNSRLIRACAGLDSESSDSMSPQNTTDTVPTSSYPSIKRQKRSTHPDGHDDKDGDEDEHQDKKQKLSLPKYAKLWACPYHKFDPARYSEQNQTEKGYRKCGTATLTDISLVKQHLRRTHKEPSFYCGNCFKQFAKKTELLEHNKTLCESCPEKFKEMMTDEQYASIPKYLTNTTESWYVIFDKLFNGRPLPASPYASSCDQATIQRFAELFQWFGPLECLDLVRLRLEREPQSLSFNVSLRAIIETTFETAFPQYLQELRRILNQTGGPDADTTFQTQSHNELEPTMQDTLAVNSSREETLQLSGQANPQLWLSSPEIITNGFEAFGVNLFSDPNFLPNMFEPSEDLGG